MDTQFSTGITSGEDSEQVGRTAARNALEGLETDRVDFCQVFVSSAYDYRDVLHGIRQEIGREAEVFGCSSSGEFTERDVRNQSVALGLLASDTFQISTGFGTGLSGDVNGTVREATRDLPPRVDGYPHEAAITLHDGLAGVGEQLTLVTQQQLGRDVSLAGGSAGDDMNMDATHVFRNNQVVRDAIGIASIVSKRPVVVTVNHGHQPISKPLTVTESKGNIVREIEGRPAFDVWKDEIRSYAERDFGITVDELETGTKELTKMLTRYEFGINQGSDYKIRWPGPTQTTNGPLRFAVTIPEGTVMRVMRGPKEKQIEAVRLAAREAREKAEHKDVDVAGAFVYDCVCRANILQDKFSNAIDAIATELDVPLVGFETYGEVCMELGQMSGYHNTTSVIMLLPK